MSEGIHQLLQSDGILNYQTGKIEPNSIFRQVGCTNKLFRTIIRISRDHFYLRDTILPLFQNGFELLYATNLILEGAFAGQHYFMFENFMKVFLQTLFSSSDELPYLIKELISTIKSCLEVQHPDCTIRAIATVLPIYIIPFVQQQLKQAFQPHTVLNIIYQAFQHLANHSKFRGETSDMLNTFLEKYQGLFDDYIKKLSEQPYVREFHPSLHSPLKEHFKILLADLTVEKLQALGRALNLVPKRLIVND
jgi:hypothetical protein